ncbi:putative membrane protein [Hamadaea flava]|uniref:DUF2231 domain-containing protein n=1 Tax=Hamadaea flava TaxID=1742688 RepID=A0ABV8LW50_9ACTN|nr:DUF2231 domain-containing protein [Hamadaea flava]MCP2329321.1 putative membrane protein [Hamadaea flava]
MQSRAKIMGHAVHPLLIVFPLGLLSTAVIFDIIYLFSDRPSFALAAAYAMAGGIVGGLIAAVFGLIDWTGIESGTRAKRIGAVHGLGNVLVVALFAVSWLLRTGGDQWQPGVLAMVFSFAGLALAGFTGWLGGELVERLGVGVDEGANADSPSSLSHMPAGHTPAHVRH